MKEPKVQLNKASIMGHAVFITLIKIHDSFSASRIGACCTFGEVESVFLRAALLRVFLFYQVVGICKISPF
jgi:hypothetical protein